MAWHNRFERWLWFGPPVLAGGPPDGAATERNPVWRFLGTCGHLLLAVSRELESEAPTVLGVGVGAFSGWAFAIKSQSYPAGVMPPAFWSWWAYISFVMAVSGGCL